jgi:lipocalin
MKRIVLSISMLLLFQATLFSDVTRTNGWCNGNYWIELNETGRIEFIIGFGDGEDSIFYNLYSQIKFQKTKDLMNKVQSEEYGSEGTTYGSIVDFLNKFYSTAQYRVIPIDKAVRWFYLSSNGKMTVKEVDDFATEMLKFYTEHPPKMT